MNGSNRISLMDPMLYQSSYINPNPPKQLKINFWKKFNIYNFMCNILMPLLFIIFISFMLKAKYLSKKHRLTQKKHSFDQNLNLIPQK